MKKLKIQNTLLYIVALLCVFVFMIPLMWLLSTSLKSSLEYLSFPPRLIPLHPTLVNFHTAFKVFYAGDYLRNSIIITSTSTFLSCIVGTLSAYALVRCRIRGRKLTAFTILALRMFPPVAVAIPYFFIFKTLNLLNNYLGLIIAYQIFLLPFVIWMMMGFLKALPVELEEAAMVDGCSRLGALTRIVLPLAVPGLVTTSIFCLMMAWNEFLFGVILTYTRAVQPMTILVGTFIAPERGSMWGEMSVLGVISLVPLFIFATMMQKYLVRGLTMGAVKG